MRPTRRQWLISTLACAGCSRAHRLRVLVTSHGLEAMPFWVATGASMFRAHGIEIDLVWADDEGAAVAGMLSGRADLAVVPPGVGVQLMSRELPFRYVANLLAREPACLIAHHASVGGSWPKNLADRLGQMRGLRVGVTVEDEGRLEVLFAEGGLSLRDTVVLRRLAGERHNVALASRQVDALFTRSPHLEKSLLYSRAVLVAVPPRGEVAALDGLMAQSVLVHPDAARDRGHSVAAFVRALQQGVALCHRAPEHALEALLEVLPQRNPTELAPAVDLYAAAVPFDLRPSAEAVVRTAALYPTAAPTPKVTTALEHVDQRFAIASSRPAPRRERLLPPLALISAAGLLGAWRGRRRGQASPS